MQPLFSYSVKTNKNQDSPYMVDTLLVFHVAMEKMTTVDHDIPPKRKQGVQIFQ